MKTDFRTTILELSVMVGFAGILSLGLQGCGDTKNSTYEAEGPALEEIPTTDGQVLVVSGNEGDTGISYTNVGDGSVLIDCGGGGCGDVYVASEIMETIEETDSNDTE